MSDGGGSVRLTTSAARDIADLPVAMRRRVARAVDGLASEPRPAGARLLAGRRTERIWRVRVGDVRILYEIRDREVVVLVIRIGHRRDIYRP